MTGTATARGPHGAKGLLVLGENVGWIPPDFAYDTSQMAIPTDRVDREQLARPSHWDIAFVRKFMIRFGPISSFFDFATFAVMLWGFSTGLAVALFSRHIDRRRGILVSLGLLSIPTALLAFAPDLVTFALLRVAQGLFMAAAFALTETKTTVLPRLQRNYGWRGARVRGKAVDGSKRTFGEPAMRRWSKRISGTLPRPGVLSVVVVELLT